MGCLHTRREEAREGGWGWRERGMLLVEDEVEI